nr:PREDICTED: uncharacterized protein LOC107078105 isoform X1 [Lepisosteus oculatus]
MFDQQLSKRTVQNLKKFQDWGAVQKDIEDVQALFSATKIEAQSMGPLQEQTVEMQEKLKKVLQDFKSSVSTIAEVSSSCDVRGTIEKMAQNVEAVKEEFFLYEFTINTSISEMKRKKQELEEEIQEKNATIKQKQQVMELKEELKRETEDEKRQAESDRRRYEQLAEEHDREHAVATAAAVSTSVGGAVASGLLFFVPVVGPVLAAATLAGTVTGTAVASVKAVEYRDKMKEAAEKEKRTRDKITRLASDIQKNRNAIEEETRKIAEMRTEIATFERVTQKLTDFKKRLHGDAGLSQFVEVLGEFFETMLLALGIIKRTEEIYHRTLKNHSSKSMISKKFLEKTKYRRDCLKTFMRDIEQLELVRETKPALK